MTRVSILCGPAGAGKTARLLEGFLARATAAPGAALWLGPTRHAVEGVRQRLLRSVTALCGARLATVQEVVEELLAVNEPMARPLTGVQRRLLLEEVLAGLHQRGQLAYFGRVLETRGFTEGLLALLADFERGGVTPAALARAAYRRGYTGGDPARTIRGRAVSCKERECTRIYACYRQQLRLHGLHDGEGRAARAGELLRQGRRAPFTGVRAVFVDGFTDFTPAQYDLLLHLAAWVEELWISLPDEPGDERAELFARPRATLQRLRHLAPEVLQVTTAVPGRSSLPAGLAHLERQLFRPLREVVLGDDADGILCVEAPGMLGEARLVARHIKMLLLEGVAPDEVLVTLRDVSPYADLLQEVFDEYGIPADVEGSVPLARNPAVALLLRALRLPDEDWPFAQVTALLRNTYFRPQWAEVHACPDVAQRAEVLLRLLGEPRGRDAYLAAVARWAEAQQPGLEDEQAEESRRRRTHELARQCGPFLERFFRVWDGAVARGPLAEHARWLHRLADDLGLCRAAEEDDGDRAALAILWHELDEWAARAGRGGGDDMDRRTFQRRLVALAGEAGLPRSPWGHGRVRVLSAIMARHLEAAHVFVMGLGERGFPRLTPPPSLLDEAERQSLQQAGLDLPGGGEPTPDEMLLFYQVVTRARRRLVLSYPAVDERGQELLPSSFLQAVRDCFRPEAIPVKRRRMLIERYDQDAPLSAAEYRVRVASVWKEHGLLAAGLPDDLEANLADAADLVRERFHAREHTPYDGLFRDPAVIAQVAQQFGPEKVFSPTALEDYVACPFRFFLRHVLRLEPLEEPSEEIEVTRRGQAFHRGLARLHRNLQQDGIHQPGAAVRKRVLREIEAAVEEDVRRAPSLASKELWRLEGRRLLRVAVRYDEHWQRFLTPWQERGVAPRPHLFEVDFGLPAADGTPAHGPLIIRAGDVEVRISGRIDRVDVAEVGDGLAFWVIDYKTGRAGHYTSPDLATFRRLQLTLYTLAVEEVLLAGQSARPLGLAYWLVTDTGPKVALPAGRNPVVYLDEPARWRAVREQLQGWVVTLVQNVRGGAFPLHPRSEDCTQTCPFGQVCRITQARAVDKAWELPLPSADGA